MSASAIIILQKANRLAELLEERAGVKGATLEARLGRAGRILMGEARAAGWRIAVAERKARAGELLDVDPQRFDEDYRVCLRHLQAVEPGHPGLPPIPGALQSGVTAVLSVVILYLGLAFAGLI